MFVQVGTYFSIVKTSDTREKQNTQQQDILQESELVITLTTNHSTIY